MRILLALLTLSTAALAQPVSLFDGKSLDGWDFDPKVWRVEDGMITGGSTTEKIKENYFICTKKSYQNFELKLKIKVSGDPKTGMLNSGIQIRSLRVPGGAHMSGYQIDCGEGWFGKIYDEFRRNKVIWSPTPEQQAALDKVVDVFGWNEYRIRAEGPRVQTWINGVLCIDYTEADSNIALDGLLGPQVHSGGVCLVQVKDVTIEELPATPNAPTWESLGGVDAARAKVAPPKKQADAGKPAKRDISYNNVQGTALSAEEQLKKFHLPEGYEIELVVKESPGIGKFVSVYFDQRGRLWTQTALEYPVDGNENPGAADALYASKAKDKVLVYPREALNATLPAGGLTNPTVFADGLAIPLGLLPWGNGDSAYILHGHDVKLFKDTNGDGKADESKVILTGFGVQDSHLFPHQFTRAPGGWIWMAQGLFNNSKVHKPGEDANVIDYPKCSMARMRPDGSEFEVTSLGPNNIWGLVITGEGETFIQEANDYGYPVMPFHEYAYYPGGMESLRKSYQPEFPVQTPDFKMGGTGLSGLALGEGELKKVASMKVASALAEGSKDSAKAEPTLCMFVANPIISKVQTLAMHREDSRKDPQRAPNGWRYEQAADLVTCDDPFFRPVAMTQGPDGCIYIVDWYNKIISHNEVPRNHPDRDKVRGRIWRVKPSPAGEHGHPGRDSEHPASDRTSPDTAAGASARGGDTARTPNGDSQDARRNGQGGRAPQDLAIRTIPDFTKLSTEELVAMLGTQPTARAHLAWQTLADRRDESNAHTWSTLVRNQNNLSLSVQSVWIAEERNQVDCSTYLGSAQSKSLALHRAIVRIAQGRSSAAKGDGMGIAVSAVESSDCIVRQLGIQGFARLLTQGDASLGVLRLLSFAKPSLTAPTAPGRTGKPIPVGEAYDREFERFLVRMFLERHPDVVAKFLDTDEAAKLPVEARVLASLALEPKASAPRVAKLLPQLDRAPNDEELLRLAQFPEEAGCGDALKALLANAKSRAVVAEKLLVQKTKLDPAKIAPLLSEAAKGLLSGKDDERALGVSLIGGFQLASLEKELVGLVSPTHDTIIENGQNRSGLSTVATGTYALSILQALRELRSGATEVFASLAKSPDSMIRDEALAALAASKNPNAAEQLFTLYPTLTPAQQRSALNALSASKSGAKAIVSALSSKRIPTTDLDGPTAERLSLVLGNDPELTKLMASLGHVFHDVLAFDGSDDAWIDSKITLDGPFTVETWIKLAPGIGNEDDILGVPGGCEMNFFQSKFRVFAGPQLHDVVVANKPMTPDLWTHIAVTRDVKGIIKIYQNGELDAVSKVPAPMKWENCRIGWSGPKKGTEGMMAEFRVWKTERMAQEIRSSFDRTYATHETHTTYGADTKGMQKGARIAKTTDYPPILAPEQAEKLDKQFAHLSELGHKKGDLAKGKVLSMICKTCHQIGNEGAQIGPNLSGAGAMGLEGVLRNILTPNAAMESGYRIFRVELKSGDIVDALFVSEDKEAFVVRQPGVQDRRIAKKDIRSTRYIRRSLMPEGLLDGLNDEQVTDLMSYLMTLK